MLFIEPTMEYDAQIQSFRQECLADGMSMDGSAHLRNFDDTRAWLRQLDPDESQYIAIQSGKMVGTLQIRHRLNEYLAKYAGHIGYCVRPSEQKKGYAKQMLALALPECKRLGIDAVLISCLADNEASRRTILANGGIYESTVLEPEMQAYIERYWVRLS